MSDAPILQVATLPNPMILLHPHIPKPLWGINPRNLFGKDNWNNWRKQTYQSFHNRCYACGVRPETLESDQPPFKTQSFDPKFKASDPASYPSGILPREHHLFGKSKNKPWLEAHEVFYYDYSTATAIFKGLIPLCNFCHNYIHRQRLDIMSLSQKERQRQGLGRTKLPKVSKGYVSQVRTHGTLLLSCTQPNHQFYPQFQRLSGFSGTQSQLLEQLPFGPYVTSRGHIIPHSIPDDWSVWINGKEYKGHDTKPRQRPQSSKQFKSKTRTVKNSRNDPTKLKSKRFKRKRRR